MFGNPVKIIDKPIKDIINDQFSIKPGQFTEEELDAALKTIKNRKAASLDEILPDV